MLSLNIPKEVKIAWGPKFLKVEGPLGSVIKKKEGFSLALKDSMLYLWSESDSTKENAYLAWIRALINGVHKGFTQKMKLIGVGYRASVKENKLYVKAGYSHEVFYEIPKEVKVVCSKSKGTILLIKGKELPLVKQISADVRALRKPDAYKGKGIHYYGETLRLKKGKREGK